MSKFEQLKKLRDTTEAQCVAASAILQTFPKGPTGLTPDDVKNSQAFQTARNTYRFWHGELGKINTYISRHFKKELLEERRKIREARYKT